MPERTAVYRLYATGGALLYVGMSNQPEVRWKQHALDKAWWHEVAEKRVDWYDERAVAAAEEMRAVAAESPRHNVMGPARTDYVTINVRVPTGLYGLLRREAFETRTRQADIIREELYDRYRRMDAVPEYAARLDAH